MTEPNTPVALGPDASADVPNATTAEGDRVTVAWVEDDESDEWARTFEARYPDGHIEYIAPEHLELDEQDRKEPR